MAKKISDKRFRENVEALAVLAPAHGIRIEYLAQILGGRDFLKEREGSEPAPEPAPAASSGAPAGLRMSATTVSEGDSV